MCSCTGQSIRMSAVSVEQHAVQTNGCLDNEPEPSRGVLS